MSSYAHLLVGSHIVWWMHRNVEPVVASLFRRGDIRRGIAHVSRSTGEQFDEDYIAYEVERDAMLERLSVMGFTKAAMDADFEDAKRAELDDIEIMKALVSAAEDVSEFEGLEDGTFQDWVDAVRFLFIADGGYQQRRSAIPKDAPRLIKRVANVHDDSLGYPCTDARFLVRALLEAFPEESTIILDISSLVNEGDADDSLVETIASRHAWLHSAAEPVLVITEGRSDSRILGDALRVRRPHLEGFFAFTDFQEFGIEGGADALVKLVRGLAASKVRTRIVALFDNDTAGVAALRRLKMRTLPPNIIGSTLPHLALARHYPTIGPNGLVDMDVNGMAGAIEMYLGETCLRKDDGRLMPVRWKNFDPSIGTYQGELEDKESVAANFRRRLETGGEIDWRGLDAVFEFLVASFTTPPA